MNILIIPSWYPSRHYPLTGSFFREQAIALANYGHNVIVLNGVFVGKRDYFNIDNIKYTRIEDQSIVEYRKTIPSFGLARDPYLKYKLFEKNMMLLFHKILSDYDHIDLVHAHSFLPAGISACIIKKKRGIPLIVTEHATGIQKIKPGTLQSALLAQTVIMSDRFICVSQALKNDVIRASGTTKHIDVLPNIVSQRFLEYKTGDNASSQHMINKKFTFISIGNLVYRKRFDLVIGAFEKAFQNNDQVQLKIIGDGQMKQQLEDTVNRHMLKNKIESLGGLSRDKVAEQISSSDCFVLASDYETFGVVYIEAMALGKPVIATRNGGADDIVKDFNGILIEKGNKAELSKAMLEIYNSYSRYNSSEIRQYIVNNYSASVVCEKLNKIYLDVVRAN